MVLGYFLGFKFSDGFRPCFCLSLLIIIDPLEARSAAASTILATINGKNKRNKMSKKKSERKVNIFENFKDNFQDR